MGTQIRLIYRFTRLLHRIISVPPGRDKNEVAQEIANCGTAGHPLADCAFNYAADQAEVVALISPEASLLSVAAPPPPEAICSVCGSDDVEWAVWYDAKAKAVGDNFGSWNNGDNTYCSNCEDNTNLIIPGTSGFDDLWESFKEAKKA
jgi:hypothetical protein